MSEQETSPEETPEERSPPEAITGIMLPPAITGIMLIRLRRHVGMTQAELARGLRVTRQTVCEWERGRRLIPPRQYEAIVDVLDVAAAALDALARRLLTHPLAPLLELPPPPNRTHRGQVPDTPRTGA